ncbi:MAG TPA: translesion DNA synthesis-associated protein ImuA [Burkholderiales bacterium]|nr:translesion DNA synthesis-associated protein ImuA [Burkholderiales bacterium]
MNTSPSAAQSILSALNHPALWHGNDFAQVATPSVPTGYAELDVHLPGAGWPTGVITEIHVERPGIGELQLVMPAAARLTQAERWLVMIAPPYLPYAPALAAHGVKLSRLMLIRPKTLAEQLWACEQALQSESCGNVMLWLDQSSERIAENALRRLQLSAERRDVLAMLFRASRASSCTQAALRLHVSRQPQTSRTAVRILKRRGGGIPAPVVLDLHSTLRQRPGAAARDDFDHAHRARVHGSTFAAH